MNKIPINPKLEKSRLNALTNEFEKDYFKGIKKTILENKKK